MKSLAEVQRAHDLLVGILLGHVPCVVSNDNKAALTVASDCLCWVLEHGHNRAFQTNLDAIEHALAERGYELRKEPH